MSDEGHEQMSQAEQARQEAEYERILAEWRDLGVPEMQARRMAAIASGVVTGDLLELPPAPAGPDGETGPAGAPLREDLTE